MNPATMGAFKNVPANWIRRPNRDVLMFVVTLILLFMPLHMTRAQGNPLTPASGLTILLTHVPANTPKNANIYVAGSFNGWQTNAPEYRLATQGNGSYAITLPATVRGHVEFKFTLGSWDLAELDAQGAEPKNRKFEVSASGASIYTGTVPAWHLAAASIPELKAELEKILAQTHTPGLSVAIVRANGPEWIAGLGVADISDGRPADADTLFRIGSTSKAFAGLAVMKLADEGKLSLQDTVRALAPEVAFENRWETTDPVRVVDLLEHTTGWDDMHLREYAKDAPGMGLKEALAFDPESRISRWRPGTRMAYCNTGPAVAAYIVEKITGLKFEDYVQQNFFDPIGMRSATYFQPPALRRTTLYHADNVTAYPYWNILFRPAGAINASAKDMAAYLAFYLKRGTVDGHVVMPAADIDRMELPTRSWAAQGGLKFGYGIYNHVRVDDGLVYHGHDGDVGGGHTMMAYLPEQGAGYFVSVNADSGEAWSKIHQAVRAYIAQGVTKPPLPAAAALPQQAGSYAGWYEPASPRSEATHFLERLLGISKLDLRDGQLVFHPLLHLSGLETPLTPTGGTHFRSGSDPVATAALLAPNDEGLFFEFHGTTFRRIPGWQVIVEWGLTVWFLLALNVTTLYAPALLLAGIRKEWRRPQELWINLWPLIALLSLVAAIVAIKLGSDDLLVNFGRISRWSLSLFAATALFAVASAGSAFQLWSGPRKGAGLLSMIYLIFTAPALLIATGYLAWWGAIGIRTWS